MLLTAAQRRAALKALQDYVRELGELPVPDRLPQQSRKDSESVIVSAERWFESIGATEAYRKRLAELGRVT